MRFKMPGATNNAATSFAPDVAGLERPPENYPTRNASQEAAYQAAMAERRRAPRSHVIKSARLVFGDNVVFNCLVLDESTGGVMVDLGAMVKVPEQLTIQFAGGVSHLAERRWMVGTKAGLKFLGGQLITEQTAERMRLLAGILQSQGITAAIQTLRAARFFDNTILREAAEAAEAAHLRFVAVLTGRA
jgi:hypothetical protein